ncbi:uncharacterized protein LOC117178720 [Belonocnema kinseyi]|uniref:uncharacterized protein LOC117178720 n=1 Tax=Belonocnema kinseyi TaxID=2817044 RepID=UPI00143D30F0|nr:uncharacterized protein LOC117178720 [Belonocnema kinseyi]
MLDLILSNYYNFSSFLAPNPLLPCHPYHPPIIFDVSTPSASSELENNIVSYNFKKANFALINSYLEKVDWKNSLLNAMTLSNNNCLNFNQKEIIDDMIDFLYMHLYTAIDEYVPKYYHHTSTYPPRFSYELKDLVIAKKIAHSVYKRTRDRTDYENFSVWRARYNLLSERCYNEYLLRTERNIIANPKSFSNYANETRNNSSMPAEMFLDYLRADSYAQIAELFATHFRSVYNPNNNCAYIHSYDVEVDLHIIYISRDEIRGKLRNLKQNKGAGIDGIPPSLLKSCCSSLTEPVFLIFNSSLELGYFPYAWKKGIIVLIQKGGDKSDVTNYRPITILNSIPKLFESLIYDKVYFAFSNLFFDEQHGFRKGRSISTNLCIYTQYLLSVLESGGQVDSVYTDFSKAFDKVDHCILISKLRA